MTTATTSFLDQARSLHARLDAGDMTPDDLLQAFDWCVSAKADIDAELSKFTVAKLKSMVNSFHAKTKAEWVEAFSDALRGRFLLGTFTQTMSYEMLMQRRTPEEIFKQRVAAERAHVAKSTQADIANHARACAERNAKRTAYVNEVAEALKNPTTIADFEHIKRYRKDGLAALTAAEKALFDRLHWTAGRDRQAAAEASRSRIEAFDLVDVEVSLHATKHTQKGHDLFVVTLSDWIEKNDFEDLCAIAHRLNGYYSSYSAGGAIPGFTFKAEADARQFVEVFSNAISTQEQRAERKRLAAMCAKDRLAAIAESMIAEADADLARPRKINTARRAGMAESAYQKNYAQKALANTLASVASTLGGDRHPLDGIRHRTHVECLSLLLKRLQWAKPGCTDINELVKDATYPSLYLTREDAITCHNRLEPLTHTVLACKYLAKAIRAAGADDRITFTGETERGYALKVFEKLGTQCPWYLAETVRLRRKLNRMNITCGVDLRHALRAFHAHVHAPEETKTKDRLILNLVGQDIPGFFPTPRDLGEQLLALAEIPAGATVIEPSAGKGDLADLIAEYHPDASLLCIERQRSLVDILSIDHDQVIHGDWLDQHQHADRIIMNPPFENGQDIAHVRHAYTCLNPGGRLVAIMSRGAVQRTIGDAAAFRGWLTAVGATVTDNPEGSFLSAFRSTGVSTVTVVIDRPAEAA